MPSRAAPTRRRAPDTESRLRTEPTPHAGSKALAAERLTPRAEGLGFVCDHPELRVERLYEQHAIVTSEQPSDGAVGARVRVVPNHACAAANLHRRAIVVEQDEVLDLWSIGAAGPGG